MYAETLQIHLPKASEVLSSLALTGQLQLVRKAKIFFFLEHLQPSISTV